MKVDHVIGRWLSHLVSLDSVHDIVEIGAFNGRGSSFLLCRAVRGDQALSKRIFGLEANYDRYLSAKRFLGFFDFYQLLWGRVIEESDLDDRALEGNEVLWLQEDASNLRKCPNVLSLLPTRIDLLLLDGGEFSSFAEFSLLKDRCMGYVVLDDILTRKNAAVFDALIGDSQFCLIDQSSERNGIAVFRRQLV